MVGTGATLSEIASGASGCGAPSRATHSSRRPSVESYSRRRSPLDAPRGTSTFATTVARPNRLSRMTSVSATITIASRSPSESAGGRGRRPVGRPGALGARNSARRSGMPRRGPEPRPGGYTRGMRTTRAPSVAVAWTLGVVLLGSPAALPAQAWNDEAALAFARRAIERRSRAAADTALRDYKAQAHGFLFFLGQFGEGLTEPPRLIQA